MIERRFLLITELERNRKIMSYLNYMRLMTNGRKKKERRDIGQGMMTI